MGFFQKKPTPETAAQGKTSSGGAGVGNLAAMLIRHCDDLVIRTPAGGTLSGLDIVRFAQEERYLADVFEVAEIGGAVVFWAAAPGKMRIGDKGLWDRYMTT